MAAEINANTVLALPGTMESVLELSGAALVCRAECLRKRSVSGAPGPWISNDYFWNIHLRPSATCGSDR